MATTQMIEAAARGPAKPSTAAVLVDSPLLAGTYVHEPPAVSEYVSPPSAPWWNNRALNEYEREVVEAALAAERLTDKTWRVAGRA
ncbi:MAG: hypothetical protein J2P30_00385 [Actinobacteria bacterium]|nr:hypothetical protein [Actinomycetota bacterium]